MRRIVAAALSAPLFLVAAACSPAGAPAPANVTNSTDDELLDTSPDSLAAPDDANSVVDTNLVQDNGSGEH